MVKWDKFIIAMRSILPDIQEDDAKVVQYILGNASFFINILINSIDNSNTGAVNQHKFSEFLKGFGPVQDCIKNVRIVNLMNSLLTLYVCQVRSILSSRLVDGRVHKC